MPQPREASLTIHPNALIALLARKDRLQLLAACDPVDLALGQVLCEPGTPTRHVYFPTRSFISMGPRSTARPAWRSAWSAPKACWERSWR